MAQISEINIGNLGLDSRLDAEYYQPAFLKAEDAVSKLGGVPLSSLGKFIVGPFGSTVKVEDYIEKSESRYIRGKDVKSYFIEDEDNAYIENEKWKRLENFHLQEKDLMVTVVGTLGNVCIVTEDVGNAIFSCKSTAFRAKDGVSPEFLCIYLNTEQGKSLLMRNARGAIQMGFNLKDLEHTLVPSFDESFVKESENIFVAAYQKNQDAKNKQKQAEAVFLSELGLDSFYVKHVLAYEADFENVLKNARIDAEYYQPKFKEIERRVRGIRHQRLSELVSNIKKGIEVGSDAYVDMGKPFIRVSNLSIFGVNNDNQQYIAEELYEELREKYEPKKGEVLLSKDGTPGMAYFIDENVEGLVSGGILRLKPTKEVEGEYLALVLNSLVVQMQIKRDAGGALIVHWRPDQVKDTLIPILEKGKRAEIVSLVRESTEARREAAKLLSDAKKQVELLIEQKARPTNRR